jgi:hypothetical protein
MKKLVATSIVTATLLLVGCGGGSSSSSKPSTTSSLTDSVPVNTPSIDEVDSNIVNDRVVGKGYYVDSPVEGVDYKCGDKNGTTDENGTFEFDTDEGCAFTLGDLKLRELNITALDNNVTVLEDNITVAQLLQTLDADGNASNGIQILDGTDRVVNDTVSKLDDLDDDLLDAIHSNLKAEYPDEYNGTVVDENQTIRHLNETKAKLEEDNRRTQYDVEREKHPDGQMDENGIKEHQDDMSDINRTVHPDGQMDENGIKEHQDDMSDINRTVHPDEQMDENGIKEHQDNSIDNNHELNPNNTTDAIDLDDNEVDTDINLNDNLETEAIEDEVSNSDSTQVIDEVDDISNEDLDIKDEVDMGDNSNRPDNIKGFEHGGFTNIK